MLKDPLTGWDGPFPYDALAPAGITPAASMKQVVDASFDLMAQGAMSPEVREAWDQLRIPRRRLFVDFFLYDVDLREEVARERSELQPMAEEWPAPPDLSWWLKLEEGELETVEAGAEDIRLEPDEVVPLPEFEWKVNPPVDDTIEFDR
jgi:hypothetical protein